MKSNVTFLSKLIAAGMMLFVLTLFSCERDCDGTRPKLYITNYCHFKMEVEVDIIGGSVYNEILEYNETLSYYPHETKVTVKAKESAPIITLSRTKNFEAQNCRTYYIELVENDSATFYDFDLKYESNWN